MRTLAIGVAVFCALAGCATETPTDGLDADATAADVLTTERAATNHVRLSVVTLNLLHGLSCGAEYCRLGDRVTLLGQWIAARDCPDIVTLQEMTDLSVDLLLPDLKARCPFTYTMVRAEGTLGADDEVVLSRYPIAGAETVGLQNGFRHVLRARIAHPVGDVEVLVTHLASGGDNGGKACPDCPSTCMPSGASTLRDCQAVEVGAAVENTSRFTLVMGDFNDDPKSFLYGHYLGLSWSDTTLAAGGLECDPTTGIGCTSGRIDTALTELEAPGLNTHKRIDFIWQVGGADCALIPEDTGLFAHEANPFVPTCGPAPLEICWPSDHVGVAVTLSCPLAP